MAGIMTSELNPRIVRNGNRHILYDAARIAKPSGDIFDPDKLAAGGFLVGKALGRGEAYFLRHDGQDWVLRHYRRGGLVAKLFHDHYLGVNPAHSRSWCEWRLLAALYAQGLPVPRPVAASVVSGFGVYRADLITERLDETSTLADRLKKAPQPEVIWLAVGRCIRRFHDAHVFHADLNANNILLDRQGQVFLIDFDRGRFRRPGSWKEGNLARLRRSLEKIKTIHTDFHFDDSAWQVLLRGYQNHSLAPLTEKPVQRAVFLDRDGTINVEKDYLHRIEDFEFIPGAIEAIQHLREAGFLIVVVTNQSGIARGYFTEDDVDRLHAHLQQELARHGTGIDAFYLCPHHPNYGTGEGGIDCDCRKGKPGMLLQAAKDWNIDLSASIMIGDKRADLEAGRAAGCYTILVRTGYGDEELQKGGEEMADAVADDLSAAARYVLNAKSTG